MQPGNLGVGLLITSLVFSLLTMGAYGLSLFRPAYRKPVLIGRICYGIAALTMIATFATLISIVFSRNYHYEYAFSHTGNELQGFYRIAATWAGQEGSFLLWAFWTAIIGFLVFAKAGKYEARVMPFFVSVLAFLAAILLKQSPFNLIPGLSAAELAAHPGLSQFPVDGQGIPPSLQNYWMTIHPPTIFFGFASLAVPFCYAIVALIWKDYEDWTPRVMPYALLTCATLGVGLFMGGYWAYETQGWHGFWGWDPVENASFFPWLAVTALVHGLVVQRDRGGMARTNTFLGLLCFWLFLLGTFLTRSGVLAENSIHSFANIGKSGLILMIAMMVVYGLMGLVLWLIRLKSMPSRKTTGDTLVSRDFAFFLAVLLMVIACVYITMGTTWPLFLTWMHKPATAPQAAFYNRFMLPISALVALLLGVVPWLAWRKTNSETFLKKLMVPWFIMLGFGFLMLFWVLAQERALYATADPNDTAWLETTKAWINPSIQRVLVMMVASLGFMATLSNAMLTWRVFRSKPINAGGWLAHVGIGVLIIGSITSNTYERTKRFEVREKGEKVEAFGYRFEYKGMTGKAFERFPINPEYDRNNAVELWVTPPGVDDGTEAGSPKGLYLRVFDSPQNAFVISPRWFAHNLTRASSESKLEKMRWPSITRYMGHDLYVGFADNPAFELPVIKLHKGESGQIGPYTITYTDDKVQGGSQGGRHIEAEVTITTPDGRAVQTQPAIEIDMEGEQTHANVAIPEITDDNGTPGVIYLRDINANTGEATLLLSLKGAEGTWVVPLEVTYKPWVNLVWVGVIIAGLGILLAMLRRALEARLVTDGPMAKRSSSSTYDDASSPSEDNAPLTAATPSVEATAAPAKTQREKGKPGKK